MKIIASSIEESITIAENVNEEFGKTLCYLWNEQMYWHHRSDFHLHLIEEKKGLKGVFKIGGSII